MIQSEQELRHSYTTLAKMYSVREKCAVEPHWDQDMRDMVVQGIDMQIEKIEQEVREYHLRHADAKPIEKAA